MWGLPRAAAAGLALVLVLPLFMGCQTSIGGMTLPSPHYLKDSPDYIPKSPDFPLPNELNSQQRAYNNAFGGVPPVGPGGLPQP